MTKIELLANKAIVSLAKKMGEEKAETFLQQNFRELSMQEVRLLAQPAPPEKEQAVEKILYDLEEELKELKASDLESFVKQKFPFLDDEERNAFISELCRPIPPRFPPRRGQARLRIERLLDQALDLLPYRRSPLTARRHLRQHFPSLNVGEIVSLTKPVAAIRQEAVVKLVRQLEDEAQERKVAELPGLMEEKLRMVTPGDLEEFIPEVTRPIPPTSPPPRKKRKKPRGK